MLLLLANLVLLAMQGGWLAAWIGRPAADAQREPARLARQINPAGLTLLPAPAAGAASAAIADRVAAGVGPGLGADGASSPTAAAMPAASAGTAASR